MSPGQALSTCSRSCAMKVSALAALTCLPMRTCSIFMPLSKRPEQMRMKATRSRCAGSMLACTLNTKPVRAASSAATVRPTVSRSPGGGACSTKASSRGVTPKLLIAEPKNTGVCLPAR